ncbi:hypothetical protein ANCCAN_23308 [Ancylostoma caninum]|uniref:Gustatory receptor n=1 Tax=Ancylostoma caninum TaxID=29170 RepID=A0A368FFF6_ANCCA|nr:hypothetical protein ANCCAN_23308 [Ancylostoma caninum]
MPALEMSHGKDDYEEVEASLEPKADLDEFTQKVLYVIGVMRLNFIEPLHWNTSKVINAVVTTTMIGITCYSLIFTAHITFTMAHSSTIMSSKLLQIAWAIQSIVSLVFLVYWQLNGDMRLFQRIIVECQQGLGIHSGKDLIMSLFELQLFQTTYVNNMTVNNVEMFYYEELRFMTSFITLYTYIAWNASMFIYIIYTNVTFLEVKYFNNGLEKLDGAAEDVELKLLHKMETYSRLCGVIKELDRIFRT